MSKKHNKKNKTRSIGVNTIGVGKDIVSLSNATGKTINKLSEASGSVMHNISRSKIKMHKSKKNKRLKA